MNTVVRNPRDAALVRLDDLVWKGIVKAATDAALPANTRTGNVLIADANGAFPTVDTITINTNGTAGLNDGTEAGSDKILVKDEATGANHGKYFLSDPGSATKKWRLTRTSDANASSEVTAGFYIFVDQGTANPNSTWVITTDDPITLNTTSITFGKFSGLGQIIAGTGMTKTGDTLNVIGLDGITANADDIEIDFNTTNLKITAGQINTIQDIDTTASPTFEGLHILEANTDTVPSVEIEQTSTGDAALQFSITGDAYAIGIDNNDSDRFKISYAAAAGTAVLGTNDRFVIDSAGLVGINVNPLSLFHVQGTGDIEIRLQQTSTTNAGTITSQNDTGATDELFLRNWGTSAPGTDFGISRNNLGVIEKRGSGNLVIGTVIGGFLVFGTNNAEVARVDTGLFNLVNDTGIVVGHTAQIAFGEVTSEAQILGTTETDSTLAIGLWSATDALSPIVKFMKSGSAAIAVGNFVTVADNEELGKIQAYGADGTDLDTLVAEIAFNVDDASIAAGQIGGEMLFRTATSGGVLTTSITIDNVQDIAITGNVDVAQHMAIGADAVLDVGGTLDDRILLHLDETFVVDTISDVGFGIRCLPTLTSIGAANRLDGIAVTAIVDGSAGGVVVGENVMATSNITAGSVNLFGLVCQITTGGGSVAPITAQTIVINSPILSGTVPTNLEGIQIDNQGASGITDSVAINIADQSGSTTNYAIRTGAGIVEFGGRVKENQGADVASVNDLTLGLDGNDFEITGTTDINLISNINWQNGSTIRLYFTSTATVKDAQATSSTNITILLDGSLDFNPTAGDNIQLTLSNLDGVQAWRETGGRNVL